MLPIEIGDGLTSFKIGEKVFQLDVVATLRKIDAAGATDPSGYGHIAAAVEIVAAAADGLLLNESQADLFVDILNQTYLVEKKNRRSSTESMLKSLSPSG